MQSRLHFMLLIIVNSFLMVSYYGCSIQSIKTYWPLSVHLIKVFLEFWCIDMLPHIVDFYMWGYVFISMYYNNCLGINVMFIQNFVPFQKALYSYLLQILKHLLQNFKEIWIKCFLTVYFYLELTSNTL